jgi:hypothetical protein
MVGVGAVDMAGEDELIIPNGDDEHHHRAYHDARGQVILDYTILPLKPL